LRKNSKRELASGRRLRGGLPTDVDVLKRIREERESPRPGEPTKKGGSFKKRRLSPLVGDKIAGMKSGQPKRVRPRKQQKKDGAKRRYISAQEVPADIPPPAIARNLRTKDVTKRARRRAPGADVTASNANPFDEISYSDHMFHDVLSVALHALTARKILDDPSLIQRARDTLERWISKQLPAPQIFVEWRHILAGTPQQIAAVAMSLTEEATRLRSSSPLGCLLKPSERAALYALLGKSSPPQARSTEIFGIASLMKRQGLGDQFIVRVVDLSQEFDGILKLMRMWRDEVEPAERENTVAAIQEMIDYCAKFEVATQLIHRKVRAKALAAFLDEWERQHGAFTAEELEKTGRDLPMKKS
jgi:hypothetical protein